MLYPCDRRILQSNLPPQRGLSWRLRILHISATPPPYNLQLIPRPSLCTISYFPTSSTTPPMVMHPHYIQSLLQQQRTSSPSSALYYRTYLHLNILQTNPRSYILQSTDSATVQSCGHSSQLYDPTLLTPTTYLRPNLRSSPRPTSFSRGRWYDSRHRLYLYPLSLATEGSRGIEPAGSQGVEKDPYLSWCGAEVSVATLSRPP